MLLWIFSGFGLLAMVRSCNVSRQAVALTSETHPLFCAVQWKKMRLLSRTRLFELGLAVVDILHEKEREAKEAREEFPSAFRKRVVIKDWNNNVLFDKKNCFGWLGGRKWRHGSIPSFFNDFLWASTSWTTPRSSPANQLDLLWVPDHRFSDDSITGEKWQRWLVIIWWFLEIGNPKILGLLLINDDYWMIRGVAYFEKPPFEGLEDWAALFELFFDSSWTMMGITMVLIPPGANTHGSPLIFCGM